MNEIDIERTRGQNAPALWEAGGGMSNTGDAQMICAPDGTRKRATYIKRSGTLACKRHALIIIDVGDVVIQADQHRQDFTIDVAHITSIADDTAQLETIARFEMGEWSPTLPAQFEAAVEAAKDKATCYHCREPHFAIGESKR